MYRQTDTVLKLAVNYTRRMHLTYVALHGVTWCVVVWCEQKLREAAAVSRSTTPCQRCRYTTRADIQKRAKKAIVIHVEAH